MAKDDIDQDARLALVLLRYSRSWDQGQLARAAGIAPSQLSVYDRGERSVPREVLERAAGAADFPRTLLSALLRSLRSYRLSTKGWSRLKRLTGEILFTDLLALGGEAIETLAAVSAHQPIGNTQPSADDRAEAEELWRRLSRYTPAQQQALLEETDEFRSWALCERVAATSIEMAPEDPAAALELARLSEAIAEVCPGGDLWRLRLRGYAIAHQGNALKVQGDLNTAAAVLSRACRLWAAGAPADPGLLRAAMLPWIEGVLLRAKRQFPEALRKLDEALALDDGTLRGKILLTKAILLGIMGETTASTAVLQEALPLVEAGGEGRTLLGVHFQLLVNLCQEGATDVAREGLAAVEALVEEHGKELDRVCLTWLQGKVAAGTGEPVQAEAALRRAGADYRKRSLVYEYALVSLDLALLLLQQDRTAELREIAVEMAWIFREQGVHRETVAALRLFCEAAQREGLSADAVLSFSRYLERARYEPELALGG